MQHEITKSMQIPAPDGRIAEPGFARTEILDYTRENIKAPWFRKKEWDYYLFTNSRFALAFTISDLGYAGILSVSFVDLITAKEHTETEVAAFPLGKAFGLGRRMADADAYCHTKRLDLRYERKNGNRHIVCNFKNFDGDKDFSCDITAFDREMESMFIVTPWKEKPTAFYYNCKRNCLPAEGICTYGDRTEIIRKDETVGCLDWGRGVWTYDNIWYWGTGSGYVDGELFGFNLGYGFSDRSSASENCLYYKDKIHKLSEVDFVIPEDKNGNRIFTDPCKITSDDGRFTADFMPILDRRATMDYKLIVTIQHQVFGRLTGTAITDDGKKIEFKDFICAVEVVRNKY